MPTVSTSPTAEAFRVPRSPRFAPPPLNPALMELDPAARDAYRGLLLFMGDSELVLGHRHSEWTGFAPSAEEDVAFSSIAQDEMGHAHLYYAILAGADNESAVDSLALDRGPNDFRHLPLLHAPNGDWFFTSARMIYWDVFEDVFLHAARQSKLPLLPGAAQRLLNEEQYHLEHAAQWLELLSCKPSQRVRLARQLERVARIAGNPVHAATGLQALGAMGLVAPAEGRASYRTRLTGMLTAAGFTPDQVAPIDAALRADSTEKGISPPGLRALHRDLTGLRRAHPGATW